MKRVIIIILLVIAIVLGYQIVVNGVENSDGEILVSSYTQVEDDSEDLSTDIAAYNTLNDTQYKAMLTSLSTSITNYKEAKEEYDALIAELETMVDETTEEEVVYVSPETVYEIDFLWATVGNYAKAEGITMTMDISKASSAGTQLTGYDNYNLSFSVTGQYIDIASFLYAIEDDDRLNFEIRNFSMTSGAATFTVPNVPIDNETLSQSTTSNSTTPTTEDGTEVTTDGSTDENSNTTVGNETVSSNSTNSTNTTNDTNSTNTDNTSNNTTNTTNSVNNTAN